MKKQAVFSEGILAAEIAAILAKERKNNPKHKIKLTDVVDAPTAEIASAFLPLPGGGATGYLLGNMQPVATDKELEAQDKEQLLSLIPTIGVMRFARRLKRKRHDLGLVPPEIKSPEIELPDSLKGHDFLATPQWLEESGKTVENALNSLMGARKAASMIDQKTAGSHYVAAAPYMIEAGSIMDLQDDLRLSNRKSQSKEIIEDLQKVKIDDLNEELKKQKGIMSVLRSAGIPTKESVPSWLAGLGVLPYMIGNALPLASARDLKIQDKTWLMNFIPGLGGARLSRRLKKIKHDLEIENAVQQEKLEKAGSMNKLSTLDKEAISFRGMTGSIGDVLSRFGRNISGAAEGTGNAFSKGRKSLNRAVEGTDLGKNVSDYFSMNSRTARQVGRMKKKMTKEHYKILKQRLKSKEGREIVKQMMEEDRLRELGGTADSRMFSQLADRLSKMDTKNKVMIGGGILGGGALGIKALGHDAIDADNSYLRGAVEGKVGSFNKLATLNKVSMDPEIKAQMDNEGSLKLATLDKEAFPLVTAIGAIGGISVGTALIIEAIRDNLRKQKYDGKHFKLGNAKLATLLPMDPEVKAQMEAVQAFAEQNPEKSMTEIMKMFNEDVAKEGSFNKLSTLNKDAASLRSAIEMAMEKTRKMFSLADIKKLIKNNPGTSPGEILKAVNKASNGYVDPKVTKYVEDLGGSSKGIPINTPKYRIHQGFPDTTSAPGATSARKSFWDRVKSFPGRYKTELDKQIKDGVPENPLTKKLMDPLIPGMRRVNDYISNRVQDRWLTGNPITRKGRAYRRLWKARRKGNYQGEIDALNDLTARASGKGTSFGITDEFSDLRKMDQDYADALSKKDLVKQLNAEALGKSNNAKWIGGGALGGGALLANSGGSSGLSENSYLRGRLRGMERYASVDPSINKLATLANKTAGEVPGVPDGSGPRGRGMGPGDGSGDGSGMGFSPGEQELMEGLIRSGETKDQALDMIAILRKSDGREDDLTGERLAPYKNILGMQVHKIKPKIATVGQFIGGSILMSNNRRGSRRDADRAREKDRKEADRARLEDDKMIRARMLDMQGPSSDIEDRLLRIEEGIARLMELGEPLAKESSISGLVDTLATKGVADISGVDSDIPASELIPGLLSGVGGDLASILGKLQPVPSDEDLKAQEKEWALSLLPFIGSMRLSRRLKRIKDDARKENISRRDAGPKLNLNIKTSKLSTMDKEAASKKSKTPRPALNLGSAGAPAASPQSGLMDSLSGAWDATSDAVSDAAGWAVDRGTDLYDRVSSSDIAQDIARAVNRLYRSEFGKDVRKGVQHGINDLTDFAQTVGTGASREYENTVNDLRRRFQADERVKEGAIEGESRPTSGPRLSTLRKIENRNSARSQQAAMERNTQMARNLANIPYAPTNAIDILQQELNQAPGDVFRSMVNPAIETYSRPFRAQPAVVPNSLATMGPVAPTFAEGPTQRALGQYQEEHPSEMQQMFDRATAAFQEENPELVRMMNERDPDHWREVTNKLIPVMNSQDPEQAAETRRILGDYITEAATNPRTRAEVLSDYREAQGDAAPDARPWYFQSPYQAVSDLLTKDRTAIERLEDQYREPEEPVV